MTTLTHLGISCRSLSNALLTFLEGRIPVRVKFFFQKRSNGKGVAHSTCLKSVRVDHFRWSGAENEGFVWKGLKKAWRRATEERERGRGRWSVRTDRQRDQLIKGRRRRATGKGKESGMRERGGAPPPLTPSPPSKHLSCNSSLPSLLPLPAFSFRAHLFSTPPTRKLHSPPLNT